MSFCVRLDPTAPREQIGGKARSLLSLAQAGLPVPPAFAVTTDLFAALRAGGPPLPASLADPGALVALDAAGRSLRAAAWPAGFASELAAAVTALDGRPEARFAVRSSAAIEDLGDALGAGLFLSRTDVSATDVPAALREVLASALAAGVAAYLGRRSIDSVGFAVLIHPFIAGDAAGSAALDSSHGAPVIETHHGDAAWARARIAEALSRLTPLHGSIEIEWVATGTEVTFLQLRPYRTHTPLRGTPPDLLGWRWDAAHNPLPLSPAQAGLVALVDVACDTGLRQKVVGGYLYYRREARSQPTAAAPATSASEAIAALASLADARLASAGSLEQALATFIEIYQPLFGVVQPAERAARDALADFLRRRDVDAEARLPDLLAGVPSAARNRAELARAFARAPDRATEAAIRADYLDRFGDESPCWDVAVPTWRETPIRLDRLLRARGSSVAAGPAPDAWHIVADATRATLPSADQATWDELLKEARQAAAAAEDDDAIYARAQAEVRRALLLEGIRLAAHGVLGTPDDVFWLALDLVRGLARGERTVTRDETTRLVTEAKRADAVARAEAPSAREARLWDVKVGIIRGRSGAGGVCVGRVLHWDHTDGPLTDEPLVDDEPVVIVARTILPTELPLLSAAALVVETGGPLDHVAAQARERGIPAVVGAAGAYSAFREGERVIVDGDAAVVARIDRR
jgi:pyruvate,water dikinase